MALGRQHMEAGRFDRAAALFGQIASAKPGYVPALAECARAQQRLFRFDEAVRLLQTAVAASPKASRLLLNLANALRGAGRPDEAMAAYRRAARLSPRTEEMQVGLALALLQAGRWTEGFALYEQRNARREFQAWIDKAGLPAWNGGPLEGRTILLVAEQGMGDTIHFVRYAALLADRGATVVVNCQPPLERLLRTARGVSAVAVGKLERFDTADLLMSLPARFGTMPDSVPAPVPYLAPPTEPAVVLPDRRRPRVGLVWAGNPRHTRDQWRSVPFPVFSRVLEVAQVDFFALQKGGAADDPRMTNLGPVLGDFADTASVIDQLDLVVTVDTSVAHLAGALGKPVWILLARQTDWRWLTERTDTPWYPTARLFRQRRLGDWSPVIGEVAAALRDTFG